MYAIVLLFQLGLFPYGGYEALLPVDPSTLPLDAMIETYRRLKTADPNDPGSWMHAYTPITTKEYTWNDESRDVCIKIRAVDKNKNPLTDFGPEQCSKFPTAPNNVDIQTGT